jgi:hypothetical protein
MKRVPERVTGKQLAPEVQPLVLELTAGLGDAGGQRQRRHDARCVEGVAPRNGLSMNCLEVSADRGGRIGCSEEASELRMA